MNFTSNVYTGFRPYTPENPVEAELMVGTQKQGSLESGIQKVQGFFDTLHGFDIAKDVTKQYIQGKISDLKTSINNISGDFSDQRLVSQIGGLAGKIASDPIVENGIVSTAAYRKGIRDIEDSKKVGKDGKGSTYGVSNEWDFLSGAQKWLNDGDFTSSFSGAYTPKYDIDKDVDEAIKSAHFDSAEWDELPKNPDGSPNTDALIEKSKKGLLSSKVQGIVGHIFEKPEVQQQLAIDGRYRYRNYTPQMLKNEQDASMQAYLDDARKKINELGLTNSLSKEDRTNANKGLLDLTNSVDEKKRNYINSLKLLQQDPEAFKIQYHTENEMQRYVNDLSWEENSSKMVANPASEMQLKRLQYNLNVAKEKFDEADANRKYGLQMDEFKLKEMIAAGKLNPDGTPKTIYSVGDIDPNSVKTGSTIYKDETKALDDQKNQLQAAIISSLSSTDPSFQYSDMFIQDRNGRWVWNTEKYKDFNELKSAYGAAIKEIDKQHLNGTISNNYKDKAQQLYDLNSLLIQRRQSQDKIESKYKPEIDRIKASIGEINAPLNDALTGRPTGKSVSTSDIVDYWMVENNKPGNEEADKRLATKFGGDYDNFKSQMKSVVTDTYPGASYNRNVGQLSYLHTAVGDKLSKDPGLASALEKREKEYSYLQGQHKSEIGEFNPKDEQERMRINEVYKKALFDLIGSKKGDFKDIAKWTEALKPANLNDNEYQFYKDASGKTILQVRRDGKLSNAIPIDDDLASSLPITKNDRLDAFNDKFGGFLKLNNWQSTTPSLTNPEAENTAINRMPVGKYSVGFHLQALDRGYVPYIYVRDRKSGTPLTTAGLELDISKLADDPNVSPELREEMSSRKSIMSPESITDMLQYIRSNPSQFEHLVDILLKNK